MSSNSPSVSVVIPARNAADVLPRALASVRGQDYDNIVEVIVAAADPRSAEIGEQGGARVVSNPGGATPSGLNVAIAASAGEVIVRCDAQSVLSPNYVSRAIETLLRTGAANVGGMQVPVGATPWGKAIAAAMSSPWGAGDARYRVGGEEGPVETVYLGVFRRDAIEAAGGFDERFQRNQDYELNHRLIAAGQVVWFDPALRVEYQPRDSLRALARQYFDYGRAKRQFARLHRGSLRLRQLAAPTLVVTLVAATLASVVVPPLIFVPVAYVGGCAVAGLAYHPHSLRVAIALITMHIGWGWGFLFARGSE